MSIKTMIGIQCGAKISKEFDALINASMNYPYQILHQADESTVYIWDWLVKEAFPALVSPLEDILDNYQEAEDVNYAYKYIELTEDYGHCIVRSNDPGNDWFTSFDLQLTYPGKPVHPYGINQPMYQGRRIYDGRIVEGYYVFDPRRNGGHYLISFQGSKEQIDEISPSSLCYR